MEDGIKLALATLTGLALFRSMAESRAEVEPSLGPFRPVAPSEEGEFELLWVDAEGRSVLEGPKRTRLVPMPVGRVLMGLSRTWVYFLIDEASTGSGTGTAELWICKDAISKTVPSSTWAFHRGRPLRTNKVLLRSGRSIVGVLP